MDTTAPAETAAAPQQRDRSSIPARFKWNLTHIFEGWQAWQAAYDELERLLSLSSRFAASPYDSYAALSTADVKHPSVTLSTGASATLTYGQYRAILATERNQRDRALAFHEYHKLYETSVNTYASL